MAKPSIQNITTTQTFQNWFDKTNEMVDIFRDSVVTASVAGDITTGNAAINGNFEATNLLANTLLATDSIGAYTSGSAISVTSPLQVVTSSQAIGATFSYAASGGRARFTNGIVSWDIGMEDSSNGRFLINTGTGTPRFAISTQGQVETEALVIRDDALIETDLTVLGTAYIENLNANNVTITGGTGDFFGTFTGDVYASNGTRKILENGNGVDIPATFTGNVVGTVSSLVGLTTDNLAEGSTNLYFTEARVNALISTNTNTLITAETARTVAQDSFSAGTGVTFGAVTNQRIPISIGQSVATNANVRFNSIIATDNITGFFGTGSDARLKENIELIDGALEKVSKINGYTFNMKGRDGKMGGVIAQELIKVFPEAVFEMEDDESGEKFYAVRYNDIIGLLIEAIKELQSKIEK